MQKYARKMIVVKILFPTVFIFGASSQNVLE